MPKFLHRFLEFVRQWGNSQVLSAPDQKPIEILPAFTRRKLYVNAAELNVRSSPELADGNKVGRLKFGQEVTVIGEDGKWLKIIGPGDIQGWVSSYYLTEYLPVHASPADAKPSPTTATVDLPIVFRKGVPNLADDPNVIRLREIINDEFGGGKNRWELQCTEYAQYRIQQLGINIRWPVKSGRHGGKWADIFERHGLYKVLDYPKGGCTMSFTAGFKSPEMMGTGHVAFVEKVSADGSARIAEANWPPPGKYNERIVPLQEWREKWKARFIDFS